MNAKIIVLLGGPGSGKTTHGKKLAEDLNLKYVDMSQHVLSDPEFMAIKARGELIPTSIVMSRFDAFITGLHLKGEIDKGFVLSGIRQPDDEKEDQVSPLISTLWTRYGRNFVLKVFNFRVEPKTALLRLQLRPETGEVRPDDDESVARKRLALHYETEGVLLQKFRDRIVHDPQRITLHQICGERGVQEVYGDIRDYAI